MSEEFLHYLWRHGRFDPTDLATADGLPVSVLHPGTLNADAGPDFSAARLLIDGLQWAGAVEIHLKASDWLRHGHDSDPAYDAVVLHVVWENDTNIRRTTGDPVPALALQGRVSQDLIGRYEALRASPSEIACSGTFKNAPSLTHYQMLDKMLVQRLRRKAQMARKLTESAQGDWQTAAFRLVARNFGLKPNAEPMLTLAQSLPMQVLLRHTHQPRQVEALLFGQAGFLSDLDAPDDYISLLAKEYVFLKRKYGLQPMDVSVWKFSKMRPASFPTVRLAQLAAFICAERQFFAKLISAEGLEEWFRAPQSDYWRRHYRPCVPASAPVPLPGKSFALNQVINTAAPLLVAYSDYQDRQEYFDRAVDLLRNLPPEDHKTARLWLDEGLPLRAAADTQGALEWHGALCAPKRCLDCAVGSWIMDKGHKRSH